MVAPTLLVIAAAIMALVSREFALMAFADVAVLIPSAPTPPRWPPVATTVAAWTKPELICDSSLPPVEKAAEGMTPSGGYTLVRSHCQFPVNIVVIRAI